MSRRKTITTERGSFRFVWSNGESNCVNVDAYHEETGQLVMEWSYGCPGLGRSLLARSAFWAEQAYLQAVAEAAE
jgi:hypothetical protein